jgi:hypothetical protein
VCRRVVVEVSDAVDEAALVVITDADIMVCVCVLWYDMMVVW